jgi:hypothetical protein
MNRSKKARGLGHRFQPGRSGNPGGRPKYSKLSHALREKLASPVPGDGRSYADVFAEILCDAGLEGDKAAIEMILQRTEGYPKQAVEVEEKTPELDRSRLNQQIAEMLAKRGLCLVRIPDATEAGLVEEEASPSLLPAADA